MNNWLFVDATITASFLYYGDAKTKSIRVNGLLKVTKGELSNLDMKLIKDFGEINHNGHTYNSDNAEYTIEHRAINRV